MNTPTDDELNTATRDLYRYFAGLAEKFDALVALGWLDSTPGQEEKASQTEAGRQVLQAVRAMRWMRDNPEAFGHFMTEAGRRLYLADFNAALDDPKEGEGTDTE